MTHSAILPVRAYYFAPTYSAYPLNQPNTALPVNNPTIPLQTVPMPYKDN